jgi:lipopolysaccharide exporter
VTTPLQGIGRKMAKGAAWMVLFKLTQRVIGIVSTLILARLLVPADFGLVAMAISVFAVLEIMSSFSFDLALIQNQSAERRHYDTVWTFNVLFALLNAVVMVVLAVPAAAFFVEPRIEWIMYSLALCALISGFDNVGVVAFQKDLELHKEFYFGVAKKLATFAVTIALAFAWKNYWALIAGMIAGRFVGLVMSYWAHPYRPRFSLAAAGELFHFSKWMLVNNIHQQFRY